MKRLAIILLISVSTAIRAEETNAVLPSLTLNPELLEVLPVSPKWDVSRLSKEVRAAFSYADKIGRLERLSPNWHSFMWGRLRLIRSTAKTDQAEAEKIMNETLELLRSWGAEI